MHATANSGGSISPSGIIYTRYGGSQLFIITPNSGYYVTSVFVNDTSVGAVSSYTVQNNDGATIVSATFTPNPTQTLPPNPTPTATSTQTASPNSTPTSTSITQPTPNIPEFPAIAVLAIFLVLSLLAVTMFRIRKRKTNKN